jgi:DNA-directed RNA polymerase subunit delta
VTSKKKIIKDFDKLPEELQEEFLTLYPNGFAGKIVSFLNIKGEKVSAVPFETEDTIFMVKVAVIDKSKGKDDDDDLGPLAPQPADTDEDSDGGKDDDDDEPSNKSKGGDDDDDYEGGSRRSGGRSKDRGYGGDDY